MESKGKARKKETFDFFVKINSNLDDKGETLKASKPNKEFGEALFFHPLDLPALFLEAKRNIKVRKEMLKRL